MGTNTKRKAGISLIVLVITIIVMIILATAIILSLSNSGIISKANKAKTDSDNANLKEYVNTLRAEYELMTAEERNGQTFEEYANVKLEEKGYNKAAVDSNGEVYSNLTESAKAAIKAGIKVGDSVTGYTLVAKTYETSGNENNGTKQTITLSVDTAVTWKYIGIGEDGSLEIAADITDTLPQMNLLGKWGYLNGPAELDKACAMLYSLDGKGTAKSMNIDHVTRILGYTGEKGAYYSSTGSGYTPTLEVLTIGDIISKKGEKEISGVTPNGKDIKTYLANHYDIYKTDVNKMQKAENVKLVYPPNAFITYWLASSSITVAFSHGLVDFAVRCVDYVHVSAEGIFGSDGNSRGLTLSLRPVVSLNSNVNVTKASEGVWEIS